MNAHSRVNSMYASLLHSAICKRIDVVLPWSKLYSSSSSSESSSPATSILACSNLSMRALSSTSSESLTILGYNCVSSWSCIKGLCRVEDGRMGQLTAILIVISPPSCSITSSILFTAFSITSIAASFSGEVVVITYNGGATSRMAILISSVLSASPDLRAFLIASIPWYAKHLTSTSARILTGFGVRRRAMVERRSARISGEREREPKTESGSLERASASDQWNGKLGR